MQPRKSTFGDDATPAPNIYSYADNMKVALEKYGHKTSASFKKGQTMKNTSGRDDAMYYISDNLNLRQEDDN